MFESNRKGATGKGHLVIRTLKVGDEYHTGMIGTQGKFEHTYGYWECRMRLQTQVGHWAGDISDAALPDNMIVDYVRVYQKKP